MAFIKTNKTHVVATTAIAYFVAGTLPCLSQTDPQAAHDGTPLSMSSPTQRIERPTLERKTDPAKPGIVEYTSTTPSKPGIVEYASTTPLPKPKVEAKKAEEKKATPTAKGEAGELKPLTPKLATPQVTTPPVAPPRPGSVPTVAPPIGSQNGEERYPTVGQMELMTFGKPQPGLAIEDRLGKLEVAIFKHDFHTETLFDRTERLKKTLLGADTTRDEQIGRDTGWIEGPVGAGGQPQSYNSGPAQFFEDLAMRPENQQELPREDLEKYALEMINYERETTGLLKLKWSALAYKIASEQVKDLGARRLVSHQNEKGENPDRRYTISGGNDALVEGLVALKTEQPSHKKMNRAMVARVLKVLMSHQDDRDSLLGPDATDFAISLTFTDNKDRLLACTEVVTSHGIIHPIPTGIQVGDKIEVKGVVQAPYKFDHITIAWEGLNPTASAGADESDEALPYFPPLDYIAYGEKSEHDYHGAVTALKMMGVVAAIAGGMFIPPVALAAPLIAMSGGMGSDPKPMSDIPVKGGMRVEGNVFSGKVPISNGGKEGIYYITVWATNGMGGRPVAISRRAVVTGNRVEVKVDEEVEAKPAIKTQSTESAK